ncbi:zinc-binding domain-containing protein [Cladorrhinum sp. PSN259]|nr:zinc-binding domain-containing protein [Cladorrhinum sp. PSN259]
MFPNLHQKVKDALEQDPDGAVVSPVPSFDGSANFDNHQEVYYTHVMGNFRCSSNKCKREGSKKVSIEIVRFKKNKYNASVFGQRCEKCNELGMLKLHEKSYVDRVVYRLKRWAGIKPKKPMRRRPLWDKPPHQRQLCEGCKIGRCKESEDYEEID